MFWLFVPSRKSSHTAYALLLLSVEIAGFVWLRVPVSVLIWTFALHVPVRGSGGGNQMFEFVAPARWSSQMRYAAGFGDSLPSAIAGWSWTAVPVSLLTLALAKTTAGICSSMTVRLPSLSSAYVSLVIVPALVTFVSVVSRWALS